MALALALVMLPLLLVACCPGGVHGLQADDAPLHFPSGPTLEQLQQPRNPAALPASAANSTASAANSTASAANSTASAANSTASAANSTASAANSTASAANSTTLGAAGNGSTTPTVANTSDATVAKTTSAAGSTPAATLQPFLQPTKSAAVLVGVFVTMALLGYLGLMVWRRVLERRYGNREILVNEEQFEQERDLGNFQL